MIHTFNKKRKLLFFPTNWANSMSAWCLGVSSPRGTIEIGNTATPVEGSPSLKLDINEARLESLFDKHLAKRMGLSTAERKAVQNIIGSSVDQKFLKWSDYIIQLDTETLVKEMPFAKVPQTEGEAGASIPENDGTTPVDSETDSQRKGRVGDSEYAAHADHQHPLNVIDSDALVAQIVKNGEYIPFGTSSYYARADHTHDLPELTGDDIFYDGEMTVGAELDELLETTLDHETRIVALETRPIPTPTAPVTSVNGKTGAVVLSGADISWKTGWTVTAGLNDYNTKVYTPMSGKASGLMVQTDGSGGLRAYQPTASQSGNRFLCVQKGQTGVALQAIAAGDITDSTCTSGGDCLAYFDANKHLAHLGNTGMTVSKLQVLEQLFDWTGSGASTDGILNYLAFGESATPTSKKMVVFAKDDPNPSLVDFTAAELQPNKVISTDTEWNTQAKVAAAAPKDVYDLLVSDKSGTSETTASKIKRIGTSTRAAREDHQHVFPYYTSASQQIAVSTTADHAYPSGTQRGRQTLEWIRGTTGTWSAWSPATGAPTQTSTTYDGVRLQVVSRVERWGEDDVLYLRNIWFDRNGCLFKIEGEASSCIVVRDQSFDP